MILWRPDRVRGAARRGHRVPTCRCWSAGSPCGTPASPASTPRTTATAALWRETFHNSNTLLAFFALSNVDILVARNVLDAHQAGLYAGGLILVKAVLFLPQFVVVLAFPSMSDAAAARATLFKSLLVVVLLGGLTSLAGRGVLLRAGGHLRRRRGVRRIQDDLWVFACLGTVLSMLQLLVYSVLARQARRAVLPGLGGAARGGGGSVSWPDSVNGLLLLVLMRRHGAAASRCSPSASLAQPGAAGRGRRHRAPAQWAAACQLLPVPTETSRGTVSSRR